jgi:hypothetical protein
MIRTVVTLLNRGIVLLFVVAVPTQAQTSGKNELAFLLGATRTPSIAIAGNASSIEVGSGLTLQLTYARQLAETGTLAWYLEFPAVAIPLQDVNNGIGATPTNYDSFFVAPSLRFKFRPREGISPWLSAGGGYALFDESAERRDGTHNVTRGTSTGTLQFGGGIDVRTPVKVLFPIGLRAEVRDFYTGKPTYNVNTVGGLQHNVVFSGGLLVTF